MTYKTKGTCSTMIDIEMEPDQHTIKSVAFTGGCNGNLKGIGKLVEGMDIDEVIQPGSRHESRGRNRTFKGH